MKKRQINIRLSQHTIDMINFLAEKYGNKTAVIDVAVGLLYSQFVNGNTPDNKTEPKE